MRLFYLLRINLDTFLSSTIFCEIFIFTSVTRTHTHTHTHMARCQIEAECLSYINHICCFPLTEATSIPQGSILSRSEILRPLMLMRGINRMWSIKY